MTKKDYTRIARALYNNRPRTLFINVISSNDLARELALNDGRKQMFSDILVSIAKELKEDNNNFDFNRFSAACEGEE